jgi:putative ABC transport system ATP-binding protein
MGLFQRLNADQRITIVLVTHEADIAEYAKRQIHFKDGLVVADHRRQAVPARRSVN